MKYILFLFIALPLMITSLKAQHKKTAAFQARKIDLNLRYEKSDSLHAIMKRYTDAGIPGVAIAVYSEKEGWWAGTEGYSRAENKSLMTNDNLQYLQSISKTYMATAILKLYEMGKIQLDSPITRYLPKDYCQFIKHPDQITVRMLLNHTSGIPEYSDDPVFISRVLQHPLKPFTTKEILQTVGDKNLMFPPGSKHHYSNTNYELLALIADALTGNHSLYISNQIFKPLGLKNTFYRNDPGYLKYPLLVNSYWDVLNTGRPVNITAMQKVNVESFIGDDGIVCTATDAIKFLKGLMEGKLLSPATLGQMETWVNDDQGNPVYGLGLIHYAAGGLEAYGHSGGGIGSGCILMYIPEKKTYVFMATNIGTLFEGSLPAKANQIKDEILAAILL